MKRHNFFLPEDVMDHLKALATERRTTTSEVIRQILIEYLKSHGRIGSSAS
jgi:metal-responsive CopG/Arc/MetJ family transcriptional regulator